MAEFAVQIVGTEELSRRLANLNPQQNKRIVRPALREMMLLSLRTSAREFIYPGGGGPPKAGILTSRTGTLRRSLASNFSLDDVGLRHPTAPFIEGGTRLIYGAVHEKGNTTHPPRPFLQPGLDQSSSQFVSILNKHWKRVSVELS